MPEERDAAGEFAQAVMEAGIDAANQFTDNLIRTTTPPRKPSLADQMARAEKKRLEQLESQRLKQQQQGIGLGGIKPGGHSGPSFPGFGER